MVRIGDILENLREIQTRTLSNPTHILISKNAERDLIAQYKEIADSDTESVYEIGTAQYTIADVGDFLGLVIVTMPMMLNGGEHEFKILEEVTPDS